MFENTRASRFKNTIIKRLQQSQDPKILTLNITSQELKNMSNELDLAYSSVLKNQSGQYNPKKKQFITPFFFNSVPMNRKALSQGKKKDDFMTLSEIKYDGQLIKYKQRKYNPQIIECNQDLKKLQQENLIELNIKAKSLNKRRQIKTIYTYKANNRLTSTLYHIKTPLTQRHISKTLTPREKSNQSQENTVEKKIYSRLKALPTIVFSKRKSSSVTPWDIQFSPLLPAK